MYCHVTNGCLRRLCQDVRRDELRPFRKIIVRVAFDFHAASRHRTRKPLECQTLHSRNQSPSKHQKTPLNNKQTPGPTLSTNSTPTRATVPLRRALQATLRAKARGTGERRWVTGRAVVRGQLPARSRSIKQVVSLLRISGVLENERQ